LIPLEAKNRIDRAWQACLGAAEYSREAMTKGYFDNCAIMEMVLEAAGKPNEYNTATFRSYDDVLLPTGPFHTFMNDPRIQELLHVRGGSIAKPLPGLNFNPSAETGAVEEETGAFLPNRWKACNDEISRSMRQDHPISSVPAIQFITNHIPSVPPLLLSPLFLLSSFTSHRAMPSRVLLCCLAVVWRCSVLLYNGEFDLNCNFLGTQETLQSHLWNGRQWKEASRSLYKVEEDVKGEHFQLNNLQFLIVRNSGLLPSCPPLPLCDLLYLSPSP
jgi:hypothetical protein